MCGASAGKHEETLFCGFFFSFSPEEEVSGAALLALNDCMVQQLVKKIGYQSVLMDLIKKHKQKSQRVWPPGSPRDTVPAARAGATPR